MTFVSKAALVLGFGSILFTLFIVFNTPGAIEQAARLEFPLTESLNDSAAITLTLPAFLAAAATILAFTQLREDYGGTVFVLVALSWLVLVAVIGIHGFQTFLLR